MATSNKSLFLRKAGFCGDAKYVKEMSRWSLYWANQYLIGACKGGQLELVNTLIDQNIPKWNWSSIAMSMACKCANVNLVKLLIHRGATSYDFGLYGACESGHRDMAELMIKCGAKQYGFGLESACKGGKLEMVKFMILCGANFRGGLLTACRRGHLEIVKYLISLCSAAKTIVRAEAKTGVRANQLNQGLRAACRCGKLKIVEYLISCGANDWGLGLNAACEGGHLTIVKLIMSKASVAERAQYINDGFEKACFGGRKNTAKYMIKCGATNLNQGLLIACQLGNLKMVKYTIKYGANDWNGGFCKAFAQCRANARHYYFAIIKLMYKKGATPSDDYKSLLITSQKITFMLMHGISKKMFAKLGIQDPIIDDILLRAKKFKNKVIKHARLILIPDLIKIVTSYCLF